MSDKSKTQYSRRLSLHITEAMSNRLDQIALLAPEPDYAERPAAKTYLVDALRLLHERLPGPAQDEFGKAAPQV